MIVIEAGAVGRCDSGRFKSSASGPSQERAEERSLERGCVLMTETAAQMVLGRHRVIRLDVVADGIFTEWQVRRKIVGRCAINVSRRRQIRFGVSRKGLQVLQNG